MKESLAARQAALERKNAALNEQVEAIEQRRQQQLRAISSTTTLPSNGPPEHVVDNGSLDHQDDEANDPFDYEDQQHQKSSRHLYRAPLAMDLSASIDSFGSKSELVPHQVDEQEDDRSKSTATSNRQSAKTRAQQPAKTFPQVESSEGEATKPESAEGEKGEDIPPEGLGLEATIRYQKARLRVLQDEADTAKAHSQALQSAQNALKAEVDELKSENAALTKKCQHTQQLLEKQRELSAAQEAKQRILETQLASAQARVEEIQRAEKQASQQFRSKDVRLNRALEELEKMKAQLQEEKKAHGEQMVTKNDYEQIVKEAKKLEKQKSELLIAFKKQMKLIDLLKRQRIHMEAAKMLSFTEEEFSKTLELG